MQGRPHAPAPRRPKLTLRVLGDNLEELVAVVLLCIIGAAMALQLGLRTIFAAPLSWPEELSQFLFVWASTLGAVGAAKRVGLVRIESLVERLPGALQTVLAYLTLVVTIILVGLLGWKGWQLAVRTSFTAAALPITWAWAYSAAPTFAVLVVARLIQLQIFGYRFTFIETPVTNEYVSGAQDGRAQ